MKKLVFATNNPHKLDEIRAIMKDKVEIVGLADIHCAQDIPETEDTLEGNSLLKARFVYDHYNLNCFADDTGLEVEALHGAPGVHTARFAGEGKDNNANVDKLLECLTGEENRKARFRTVITLILDGDVEVFEGYVNGEITKERQGTDGFGYDPVFKPEGYKETFAEMGAEEKNRISHRGMAVRKLCDFLHEKYSF